MKNLGRIFTILFLIQFSLYADVTAYVDNKNIAYGDLVTFNLDLSGEKIQKPNIFSLCGENVVSTSSSTSIQSINGDFTKKYILSYKFIATKSCTIDPIVVNIGGKEYSTKPIDIVVGKRTQTKDKDFSLELLSDKQEVYVGEPFDVTLLFKQKRAARVVDNKFNPPTFSGFWVKGEPKEVSSQDALYTTTKVTYKLAPQREGNLTIDPAQISLAFRHRGNNFFGGFMDQVLWKNYYSNDLKIKAKPLPNDVKLIGDFTLSANVNKTSVNANEAVNLNIKVVGDGNLEDIENFKPYIDGVSVFDEEIVIHGDELTQKIAFVADESFTIPAFSLKYFDLNTKQVKSITTKPIDITVKNAKIKEELKVQRADAQPTVVHKEIVTTEIDKLWVGVAFVIGLILGIFIMIFKNYHFSKSGKKHFDINDHKLLLLKLLPYAKEDKEVQEIVDIIEGNLYSESKRNIDKKNLKRLIKKYNID